MSSYFRSPRMKPCKSANYFILDFNFKTVFLDKKIVFIMKNLTEFCKTVETSVDPQIGGAGFRTPGLSHAKRTLYH